MNISKIVRSAKCGVLGALVALGMTAVAADQEAVQLWKDGPYWATSNLGESKVAEHPEYGALYKFDDAGTAVKSTLGEEWRVPSKDDFDKLVDSSYCTMTWDATKKGYTITGKGDYSSNSIFLPAAGSGYGSGQSGAGVYGFYWSSEAVDDYEAWSINFDVGFSPYVELGLRSNGFSVRAVRDTAPVTGPTVTIDAVKLVTPWDSTKGAITVDYSLAGLTAGGLYKVAFDVTAKGQTASVTNDAAKLTDGATNAVIDTVALFGKEVVDTKAKVKVTLIAVPPPPAGQLWKDGPIWAECNVGATVPGDYGEFYTFSGDKAKSAAESLGAGWHLPTKAELDALLSNCNYAWETSKDSTGADINGCRFTGKGNYSSNSIFLPAAGSFSSGRTTQVGISGVYWSSEKKPNALNRYYNLDFTFDSSVAPQVSTLSSSFGALVRAVRDAK